MKASELITVLETLVDKNGDLELSTIYNSEYHGMAFVEPYKEERLKFVVSSPFVSMSETECIAAQAIVYIADEFPDKLEDHQRVSAVLFSY